MTAFAFSKLLCSIIAMVTGIAWIWRREASVTSEGASEALYYLNGWAAVTTGLVAFIFGIALLLDAFGVVVWIGER